MLYILFLNLRQFLSDAFVVNLNKSVVKTSFFFFILSFQGVPIAIHVFIKALEKAGISS